MRHYIRAGLVKLKQLLQRYNAKYKTNFIIPRTYVIPITEFAEYERTKTANENAVVKYRYVLQSIIQYTDK